MRIPCFSIGVALLLMLASTTVQAAAKGEAIYREKCLACHSVKPEGKVTIAEAVKIQGPPLWFAGSKFQPAWLKGWLAAPTPLLGVKWNSVELGSNRHPALAEAEAAEVAAYLGGLIDEKLVVGKATPMPDNRGKKRAFLAQSRVLFEKHQGCFACHQYLNRRNAEIGGFTGPSLVQAPQRLNPDWVHTYLQNPERYYPNRRCPIPGEMAVNDYTAEQLADLATLIVSFGDN